MRRALACALAITTAVLAPRPAAAQGEDPAGEFLFGDLRMPLGYGNYRRSFVELGYTFGVVPWLSYDGRQPVMGSGLYYDENKGPLINIVTLVLLMSGISDWQYEGSYGQYDVYRYDPAAAEQQRQGLREAFSHLPLSMGARIYNSALGSDFDGFVLEGAFRDPIGDDAVPVVVWAIGAHLGWFGNNVNWNDATHPLLNQVWGGFHADVRITLFEYMGIWLRVAAWFGERIAVPIELGPEILIGNRFVIRGTASFDPVRIESLPDGIGVRLEAGVRL